MKAPDKIYLQEGCSVPVVGFVGPAWNNPKDKENTVEYIRKEALLEWLNDVENVYNKETDGNSVADGKYYIGMCEAFEMVANKLNSM